MLFGYMDPEGRVLEGLGPYIVGTWRVRAR